MSDPRLCLIYCRVSTSRQERWSPAGQERALVEHATRQGWRYEIHHETGSGETIEARPVFRGLLERIARGEAHTLLVIEAERLTRPTDLRELALIHEACRAGSCRIATPGQTLDLHDAEDTFLSTLFGALAAREKGKLLVRQKRGIAEARASGRWIGGGAPLGYRYDRAKRNLVIDQERVELVRALLEAAAEHGTLTLGRMFPTLRPLSIYAMITRRRLAIYSGRRLLEDGTTTAATWPAIITPELAARINLARERRRTARSWEPSNARLLTALGIWRCGHCGSGMRGRVLASRLSGGQVRRWYVYLCLPWWKAAREHECVNKRSIRCDLVDAAVARAVWDALPALLAAPASPPAPRASGGAAARLEAAQARRDRLVAAIEDGTLSAAEARDRIARARRDVQEAAREAEEEAVPEATELPRELRRLLARPPSRVPMREMRALLRAACRRVELFDRRELRITFSTGAVVTCRL